MKLLSRFSCAGLLFVILLALPSLVNAQAIGPRGGYDFDTEDLVLGVEGEFGRVFRDFQIAPSIDFEFGDHSFTAFNGDFRMYLFHLPETGLKFYGSAGPTLLMISSNNNTDTELGLSVVAGMRIPMQGNRRYNIETRFGFGDIPDFKLMVTILFGI
ncbi:MAG: hypothetical protein R3F48_00285 [Candidatus Zixiibacteriota bacterium]